MDYTKTFLTRLQEGESVESIAAEITKALNSANQEHERIKAEEAAKNKAHSAKVQAVKNLISAVHDVAVVWDMGDDVLAGIDSFDPEEVVQEVDSLLRAIDAYGDLFSALTPTGARFEKPEVKIEKEPAADPLEEFLNMFVR